MPSPQWYWNTERNWKKAKRILVARWETRFRNQRAVLQLLTVKRGVPVALFREGIWPYLSETLPGFDLVSESLWIKRFLAGLERPMLIQYHVKCLQYLKGDEKFPTSGKVRCTLTVDGQTFIWNPGF